jgi:hypothetical protein
VAKFVSDNACYFFAAKRVEEPGRRADGRVLRISAGGESIGLWAVHQADARHRQGGPLRQLAHNARAKSKASDRA